MARMERATGSHCGDNAFRLKRYRSELPCARQEDERPVSKGRGQTGYECFPTSREGGKEETDGPD